ncbi:MAG: hypothetical protein ABEH59_12795 [Halobacteriales archaeon]
MAPKPSSVDPEQLREVEESLDTHIDRLEAKDVITEADLQEFREALPTQPWLAELVELALPWPLGELFEYVEASERQAAYWRISHDRQAIRSEADFEHKRRFALAAKEARGTEGTVERDGQTIPESAAHVADALRDEETSESEKKDGAEEQALGRLSELLGE